MDGLGEGAVACRRVGGGLPCLPVGVALAAGTWR